MATQGEPVARIVVITGPAGGRKTALCLRLVEAARAQGLLVRGVVSPPHLVGGVKVSIDVIDLSSGERRSLAESVGNGGGPATSLWHFHADALAWSRAALQHSLPCDLLVIDELGPLELLRGGGWAGAVDMLRAGGYRWALVVVRPRLLARFLELLGPAQTTVVSVTQDEQDELIKRIAQMWNANNAQD